LPMRRVPTRLRLAATRLRRVPTRLPHASALPEYEEVQRRQRLLLLDPPLTSLRLPSPRRQPAPAQSVPRHAALARSIAHPRPFELPAAPSWIAASSVSWRDSPQPAGGS